MLKNRYTSWKEILICVLETRSWQWRVLMAQRLCLLPREFLLQNLPNSITSLRVYQLAFCFWSLTIKDFEPSRCSDCFSASLPLRLMTHGNTDSTFFFQCHSFKLKVYTEILLQAANILPFSWSSFYSIPQNEILVVICTSCSTLLRIKTNLCEAGKRKLISEVQLYHAWIVQRRLKFWRVKRHVIKPCILTAGMAFLP